MTTMSDSDAGLAVLDDDFTVYFGSSESTTRVPLRVVMRVVGRTDLVDPATVELHRAPSKALACAGEALLVHVSRHQKSLRVAPAAVLSPDTWHCLLFAVQGHAVTVKQTFRTLRVPPPTHELWPPPNSSVPANLDSVTVFSKQPIERAARWHAALIDESRVALAKSARSCQLEGLSRSCLRYFPRRLLHLGDASLVVTRDDDFATEVSYTVVEADHRRPKLVPLGCMPGATTNSDSTMCIRETASDVTLLMQVDEPALINWRYGEQSGVARAPFGEARISFEHDDAVSMLELFSADVAGNFLQHSLGFGPASDRPALTIEALRPNPRGPEPQQELLTLYNHGQAPIQLSEFRLGAMLGESQILPEHALHPGKRVVLVPPGFDPQHPEDVAPPVGVPLLRLASDITDRGVSNQGEQVQLWGANQEWVCGLPAMKVSAGQCLRRRKSSSHTDLPNHFVVGSCFDPLP